jgi:hypothetical protein
VAALNERPRTFGTWQAMPAPPRVNSDTLPSTLPVASSWPSGLKAIDSEVVFVPDENAVPDGSMAAGAIEASATPLEPLPA